MDYRPASLPTQRTPLPPLGRLVPDPVEQLGLDPASLSAESKEALAALFDRGGACMTPRSDGGYRLRLAMEMDISGAHLCRAAQAFSDAGQALTAAKLLAEGILCRRAADFDDESPAIEMLADLLRQNGTEIDDALRAEVTVYVHMLDSCGILPVQVASHFSLERVTLGPGDDIPNDRAIDKLISTAARLCTSKDASRQSHGCQILTAVIAEDLLPHPGESARQRAVDELGKASCFDETTGCWNAAGLACSALMDRSVGTSDLAQCEQTLEALGCKVRIELRSDTDARCTVTGFDPGEHGKLMRDYVVARLLDPSLCPMPVVNAFLAFLCEQLPEFDLLTVLWEARLESVALQSPEPDHFKSYCIELLVHIAAAHRLEPSLNRSIDKTFHVLQALHRQTSDEQVFEEIVNLAGATPTDLSPAKVFAVSDLQPVLMKIWRARLEDENTTHEERALSALGILILSEEDHPLASLVNPEAPVGTPQAWKSAIPLALKRIGGDGVTRIQAWLTRMNLAKDCPMILAALIGSDQIKLTSVTPLVFGAACISHEMATNCLVDSSFTKAAAQAAACAERFAEDAEMRKNFLSLLKAGLRDKPWAFSILKSDLKKRWELA
jgi:hypothetical protein